MKYCVRAWKQDGYGSRFERLIVADSHYIAGRYICGGGEVNSVLRSLREHGTIKDPTLRVAKNGAPCTAKSGCATKVRGAPTLRNSGQAPVSVLPKSKAHRHECLCYGLAAEVLRRRSSKAFRIRTNLSFLTAEFAATSGAFSTTNRFPSGLRSELQVV
jgi:hypothetical protein